MSKILVYVATQKGQVRRASLEVLTRCRDLAAAHGMTLEAALIGTDPAPHVDAVRAYGPSRVYTVADPVFERHINTPLLDALEAVIERSAPRVVAMASSEAVKDVLGALGARLDAAVLPDVASFDLDGGRVEAVRPVLAAKFLARTRAEGDRVLVSVRAGAYHAEEAPSDPDVEAVPFSFDASALRQRVREEETATAGAVDLSEARVVVAAGRGVRDEAGKKLIDDLAAALGAAVGSSRAVVESGLFSATTQVGQTGKVVSPDLYFAVGISGAIQHVAGMSNSRVIVAINKDPDAPIFRYATYGIVGDLYDVLPPLIASLNGA